MLETWTSNRNNLEFSFNGVAVELARSKNDFYVNGLRCSDEGNLRLLTELERSLNLPFGMFSMLVSCNVTALKAIYVMKSDDFEISDDVETNFNTLGGEVFWKHEIGFDPKVSAAGFDDFLAL